MNEERIAKMTDNVATDMTADEFPQATVPHIRTEATTPDEDIALENVDQALDAIVAAFAVLDDNLGKIKIDNVPEQAAVDAVKDLLETAVKPYFADALKAMAVFGK
jgi:hypothetical protein